MNSPERAVEQPVIVAGDAALARHCELWAAAPLLALDTEFLRERTYYPIPGLVQLCDGQGIYLLDVATFEDWTPFARLLADTAMPKVMHAGSEDLELFQRVLGVLPQPLYDTQIGAALAGLGFSLSYQALVDRCVGIEVPKDMTRTDWTRRPLSPGQLVYAARDVAYLPAIFQQLSDQLEATDRLGWWQADSAQMTRQLGTALSDDALVARVKGAWRLAPHKLAVLRALVIWREALARERDIPRGFVIKDPQLLELALRLPTDRNGLVRIDGVGEGFVRRYGDAVLEIIDAASALPESELPEILPQPLDRAYSGVLKGLRTHFQQRAEALGMAPEMLVRRQDGEQLLRSYLAGECRLPDNLRGWRAAVVGDDVWDVVARLINGPGDGPQDQELSA